MTPANTSIGFSEARTTMEHACSMPHHRSGSRAHLQQIGYFDMIHGANLDSTSTSHGRALNDTTTSPRIRRFEANQPQSREHTMLAPLQPSRDPRDVPNAPFKRYGVHDSTQLDGIMYYDPFRVQWILRDLNLPVSHTASETILSTTLSRGDLDYRGLCNPYISFHNATWVPELLAPQSTTLEASPALAISENMCSNSHEVLLSPRSAQTAMAARSINSDATPLHSPARNRASQGSISKVRDLTLALYNAM